MCDCRNVEFQGNSTSVVPSVGSDSKSAYGLRGSWNGCYLDSHCHVTPLDAVLQERLLKDLQAEFREGKTYEGDFARDEAGSWGIVSDPGSERTTGVEGDFLRSNKDSIGKADEEGRTYISGGGEGLKNLELEDIMDRRGGGVVVCGTDPSADWGTIDTLLNIIAEHPKPFFSSFSKSSEEERNELDKLSMKFGATSHKAIERNSSSARLPRGVKNPQHGGLLAHGGISCQFYAGFGLHPWYVAPQLHDNHAALLALEEHLLHHPNAIVGEVGLDALRGPPLEEVQVPVFIAQLRLAAAFHRPVSVHCVRAYPVLQRILSGQGKSANGAEERPQYLGAQGRTNCSTTSSTSSSGDILFSDSYTTACNDNEKGKRMSRYLWHAFSSPILCAEDLPPAIILHGFSGSVEIAKALLHLKPLSFRESMEGLDESLGCSGRNTLAASPTSTPFVSPAFERSSTYCPPSHLQRSKKEMREVPTVDSSFSQCGSQVMKKKPRKLSASPRLFFGVGAATTLRLKAATTSILLPLLIATHRVLVESDEFYAMRCQTPFYDRTKVDHPSSSLSKGILVGCPDNTMTAFPICNGNSSTTSSLSWSLQPRCDVVIDAPSTAASSVHQVIDALSPFVVALPNASLPSPASPSRFFRKDSLTPLEESVARKKENNTVPDAAISAPASTDLRTPKPDSLTLEKETKTEFSLLGTESRTASHQAKQQRESSFLMDRFCSCTGSSCMNEAVDTYLRRSFFNAFSSVM